MYTGNKQYSFEEVLSKLMKYCSYQERSKLEVTQKALHLGLKKNELEQLVEKLIADNFINEKRFVSSYVRGKLNIKKWGKYKIREGLRAKGVSETEIQDQLSRIDQSQFKENLIELVEQRKLAKPLGQEELSKHYRYFMSRGYESGLIMEVLKEKGLLR